MDAAFRIDSDGELDLAIEAGDLARDDGLRTALLLSLLSDARAEADELPAGERERRGWWGEALELPAGERFGSKLWLLAREKATPATAAHAEAFAREALAWLIEEGLAEAVEVTAAPAGRRLDLAITLKGAAGESRFAVEVLR